MEKDSITTVEELKTKVWQFIHDRAWDIYHNPKDIAESICIEAGELLERFQWFSPHETLTWKSDASKIHYIEQEVADVIIYCLSLANALGIDLAEAVLKKLKNNEWRDNNNETRCYYRWN